MKNHLKNDTLDHKKKLLKIVRPEKKKIEIKNEYLIYIWEEINSVNWTNMT